MKGGKVTFSNSRARFQRLQDAKLFNGWVNALNSKGVIVSVAEGIGLSPGEQFRFEVFGTRAVAVFEAQLEILSGSLAAFVLSSSVRTMSSTEEMRVRTRDVSAKLFLAPLPLEGSGIPEVDLLGTATSEHPIAAGDIVDISLRGLGLLSEKPLAKGERLRMEIETPWGRCEGFGEVRYCKADRSRFRVGIEITEMDRLNRGVFERLFNRTAAA